MQGLEDIMRQAQIMQQKMTEMQEALGKKTVEASSGGGMVRVVCTGTQEVRSVTIDRAVVNPEDVEMLQDLVAAAVNTALALSKEMAAADMAHLTGGLSIPGLTPKG